MRGFMKKTDSAVLRLPIKPSGGQLHLLTILRLGEGMKAGARKPQGPTTQELALQHPHLCSASMLVSVANGPVMFSSSA